ncbi:MAG: O-methyltransferase, partial [Lutibacter sp.]
IHEMIVRQISATLINRNGAHKDLIEYKQLFNFVYKDNATILTIGGLIFDKSIKNIIPKMAFNELPFIQEGLESYKIQSPNLTLREIKALDKALPDYINQNNGKLTNKKLQKIPVIPSDIKNYSKVYRYYPNFTESNL